ncbi:MAG: MMPL family transporter [Candidatus Electryonea clarkiae]|nr:MMPL family transporter [Candidatus Electryonea clarkiae]MDP8288560.1 MMPL family transporter [Candidatus Electryonea clarkiae]
MNEKITKYVLNYPKTVIICSLIITFLFGLGIPKIRMEEDIKEMLPKDLPARLALNEVEDIFGGSDVFLVAVNNEEETIFNRGTLAKILEITDSLDVIPGILRVSSLATVNQIKSVEWGMEVTPFLEEVPETEEGVRILKKTFYDDSLYVGSMVSNNGKYAAIIAVVDKDAKMKAIYEEVLQLTDRLEGPENIYLAGTPVVSAISGQSMKADMRQLIPFVLLVAITILYASFRTLSGVFLPLLATLMGVVSMVGVMGHFDIPFMIVNNVMPVVLVAVGIAYGIHVMSAYYDELILSPNKKDALTIAIRNVGTPVIMAGLTTIAGFLSLTTSPLPVYLSFGIVLAFGVFMAMLFTLTVIPAILVLMPVRQKKMRSTKPARLTRLLTSFGEMVLRLRYAVIAVSTIIIIIFAFGIPLVNLEMNSIKFFSESSDIRQADIKVNQNLGGSINMNLLVNADIENAEVLAVIDSLQQLLEQFPETGSTISLATIIKRINRVLHDDNPEFERIPETKEAVAQAMLLYNMSGSPEDYEALVDNSFENALVGAMMKSESTTRIAEIADEMERYYNANFKNDDFEVKFTGFALFIKELLGMVVESVVRSLIAAIFIVFLLAWITYRSWKIGILAIIPIAVTVIINFGLMGYAGIDLSIPTAMVSIIIIGIGVDFAFHFLSRFKIEMARSDSLSPIVRTIRTVGRPIFFNAAATGLGFSVLMYSSIIPLRFMGFLISVTMVVCAIGALTILATALTFIKTK